MIGRIVDVLGGDMTDRFLNNPDDRTYYNLEFRNDGN